MIFYRALDFLSSTMIFMKRNQRDARNEDEWVVVNDENDGGADANEGPTKDLPITISNPDSNVDLILEHEEMNLKRVVEGLVVCPNPPTTCVKNARNIIDDIEERVLDILDTLEDPYVVEHHVLAIYSVIKLFYAQYGFRLVAAS